MGKKTGTRKHWFTARAIYRCDFKPQKKAPRLHTFEDLYFLVHALNNKEALTKARKVARAKQHHYRNQYGQTVSWVFIDLLEVQELIVREWATGVEVFYRFFEGSRQKWQRSRKGRRQQP